MAGEGALLLSPHDHTIEVTLAAAATAGDVLTLGEATFEFFGIALDTGAIGDKISVAIRGKFKVPKDANAFTQGNQLYYNATDDDFQESSVGGTIAGVAAKDAAAGDSHGEIILFGPREIAHI